MKKFGVILIWNLLGTLLCSQQIHFSRNYPFATGSDYTAAVVQKPDSGYVFVSNILQSGFRGFTFSDTDIDGDTIFTKKYEFPNYSFSIGGAHSLIIALDGNYVQCGSAMDPANDRQGYVIKFDAQGDTLWMKDYGGAATDVLYSMQEDGIGNLWVCGSTSSSGNGLSDFWLLKLDANGNVLMDSTYGTSANEGLVCGDITFDGGFVLSGLSGSLPYVVKVSGTGVQQWAHVYPGYSGYGFITQLPDSHFVLACNKITGPEDYGALVNLDTAGIESWYALVGFPTYGEVLYSKPVLCPDGIAVAGITSPPSSAPQGYLVKTNYSGNTLWQRVYTLNASNSHYVYDIQPTSDNGFILAGSCFITNQDAWLVKVDSLGCEVAGCDGVGTTDPVRVNSVSVYPNPSFGEATIQITEYQTSESYVEIISPEGKLIDHIPFDGRNTITLSTEKYQQGVYLVRVFDGGILLGSEKLVIVK